MSNVGGWPGRQVLGLDHRAAARAVELEDPAPRRVGRERELVPGRVDQRPVDLARVAVVDQRALLVVPPGRCRGRGRSAGTTSARLSRSISRYSVIGTRITVLLWSSVSAGRRPRWSRTASRPGSRIVKNGPSTTAGPSRPCAPGGWSSSGRRAARRPPSRPPDRRVRCAGLRSSGVSRSRSRRGRRAGAGRRSDSSSDATLAVARCERCRRCGSSRRTRISSPLRSTGPTGTTPRSRRARRPRRTCRAAPAREAGRRSRADRRGVGRRQGLLVVLGDVGEADPEGAEHGGRARDEHVSRCRPCGPRRRRSSVRPRRRRRSPCLGRDRRVGPQRLPRLVPGRRPPSGPAPRPVLTPSGAASCPSTIFALRPASSLSVPSEVCRRVEQPHQQVDVGDRRIARRRGRSRRARGRRRRSPGRPRSGLRPGGSPSFRRRRGS